LVYDTAGTASLTVRYFDPIPDAGYNSEYGQRELRR